MAIVCQLDAFGPVDSLYAHNLRISLGGVQTLNNILRVAIFFYGDKRRRRRVLIISLRRVPIILSRAFREDVDVS